MTALIATAIAWAGFTVATLVAGAVTIGVAVGFAAWGGSLGASRRAAPPKEAPPAKSGS